MKNNRFGARITCALFVLLLLSVLLAGCRLGSGVTQTTAATEEPVTTAAPATAEEPATTAVSAEASVTEETPQTDEAQVTAAPPATAEPPTTTAAPATAETPATGEAPAETLVEILAKNAAIPAFNQSVLKAMHVNYTRYYIGTLGSDADMAEAIVGFYEEYKYLIDESDPDDVTDLLCECYLAAAGDKYAYYMNPEAYKEYSSDVSGNYVGIGVQVTNDSVQRIITVTAVFPNTPAFEAGVLAGDTIEAVGDVSVLTVSFNQLINLIRGEEGTDVTVTFGRNGETYTRTMTRRTVVQVTASAKILPGSPKIGVLSITEFDKTTVDQFKTAFDWLLEEGVEGIIFDVRDNPGGLLTTILQVLDYLVPDGTPLAGYVYFDGDTETTYAMDGHEISSTLPIVVLCNAHTASAGELFTCGLQDYGKAGLLNVQVVGTVTYGKGSMQTLVPLSSKGHATTITFAYYNPPYSGNYEGVGVIPDIAVELGEEAQAKSLHLLTEEEDTQMQAAILSVAERTVSE